MPENIAFHVASSKIRIKKKYVKCFWTNLGRNRATEGPGQVRLGWLFRIFRLGCGRGERRGRVHGQAGEEASPGPLPGFYSAGAETEKEARTSCQVWAEKDPGWQRAPGAGLSINAIQSALKKVTSCLEGKSITPRHGEYYSFSILSSTPSYHTLEGLLKLT